ncbi:patatin-like phospholipase family protein [Collimonas sp.]|jgi:NTE family protein|uniref:patatin-like phospholipase family protein n=1 Tax=Collimonas sp. TaxID=1963772 RepID=UPI002C602069|nr:patatin-like phospholipase family protein [Collimonas sp.]HWW05092.1 patatin-like phospholipase family protein [Collimonas sp.]
MPLSKRNNVISRLFHSLCIYLGCLLLSLAHASPALAAPERAAGATDAVVDAKTITPARPRIGLVLSGGGARGYAHLGVLQALEQMHIPIDYVAATSMGAVVGGLYASGLSVEELDRILTETNLSDIAFDRNERAELPQSQREDDFQYPIGLAAGYGDGKLKLPAGLVQGNNLLTLLQNWTPQLPANISFDKLPTPFRAVATDLGSGAEVILSQGSLPRAIRASMAVPGLFAPLKLDGRTLVDGGLVRNLPVSLARSMGADIIIAVNIATDLEDPSTLDSPTSVAQQMVTILIRQNVRQQIDSLKQDDVLIEPDLGDLSFSDFSRGKDGVKAGYDAAQRQRAKLAALALQPQEWKAYLAARSGGPVLAQDTHIDAIEIHSNGRVPAAVVRRALNVSEGDLYNPVALNKEVASLSTNGDFKSVTQELVSENGRNVLKVEADEKSWGPHFLLFGLGMSNNFDGRGDFNLQIGHRLPWLTQSGLEWRNDIVLGSKQASLHTELRQPIWNTVGLYVAPYAEYGRRHFDIYTDNDANSSTVPLTAYRLETTKVGVDLGMPIGRLGEFRAGVYYQWQVAKPIYNFPNIITDFFPDLTFDTVRTKQPVVRTQLTVDQLDDPLFPRKGYYLSAISNVAFGGANNSYSDAQGKALWAASRGGNTLNLALEAAGTYGNESNDAAGNGGLGFTLGGFQHLSAYAPDQFTGNYLLYSRLTYLRDMPELNLPGLRSTVLGTSLEAGDVWQTRTAFGSGPLKKSASVFLGGSSFLGPLYFGLALAPRGVWNVYLQLGRVF